MSNGEVCCILGVCCPPDSPEQLNALAKEIGKVTNWPEIDAVNVAKFMLDTFDLAPKGSLAGFVEEIARMARNNTEKE